MNMLGTIIATILILLFVVGVFDLFQRVTAALTGTTGLTGKESLQTIFIEVGGLAILMGLIFTVVWAFGLQ